MSQPLSLKIVPTSCRCGGTHAWMKERPSGAWEMVGCVCHTDLGPVFREHGIFVEWSMEWPDGHR